MVFQIGHVLELGWISEPRLRLALSEGPQKVFVFPIHLGMKYFHFLNSLEHYAIVKVQ
jgi:hypothetical protein